MAFIVADRVREFSTTSGTGMLYLTGAATGFRTFVDGVGNGNTTFYAVSVPGGADWEVGIGTVGVGTLTRDVVLASSTGGAKVNFTAGTKDVFSTLSGAGAVVGVGDFIIAPVGTRLPVAHGGTGVATAEAEITRLAGASNVDDLLGSLTTTNLAEGSNLYFTAARVETVGDGLYLRMDDNLASVGSVSAARDNLGLGTAALANEQQLATEFWSATEPDVTWPGMVWADLGTGWRKRRNETNDAWVIEGRLFRSASPIYEDTEIPTTDIGPIYVVGQGDMEWNATAGTYVAMGGGAQGGGANKVFWVNDAVITEDFTVKDGTRAGSFGPIEIAVGATVTVEPGGVWTIV